MRTLQRTKDNVGLSGLCFKHIRCIKITEHDPCRRVGLLHLLSLILGSNQTGIVPVWMSIVKCMQRISGYIARGPRARMCQLVPYEAKICCWRPNDIHEYLGAHRALLANDLNLQGGLETTVVKTQSNMTSRPSAEVTD